MAIHFRATALVSLRVLYRPARGTSPHDAPPCRRRSSAPPPGALVLFAARADVRRAAHPRRAYDVHDARPGRSSPFPSGGGHHHGRGLGRMSRTRCRGRRPRCPRRRRRPWRSVPRGPPRLSIAAAIRWRLAHRERRCRRVATRRRGTRRRDVSRRRIIHAVLDVPRPSRPTRGASPQEHPSFGLRAVSKREGRAADGRLAVSLAPHRWRRERSL